MFLLAVGITHLTGWRPLGRAADALDGETSARLSNPSPAPPPVLKKPEPTEGANPAISAPVSDAVALKLKASPMLQPKPPRMAPATETPASPDTLTLQSEKWLHSKEP